jgi:hypothetical protein
MLAGLNVLTGGFKLFYAKKISLKSSEITIIKPEPDFTNINIE